ncbi:uncharacterized protein I303_100679 [Kwoniella dejecticola CBS 10117]|uniref:Uncharacterized protein n=1 Tax=Kwoniella dejecticola CBS 10117 TaxID=1296121 RepID=A0A1A6AFN1_9TREE|nr:uncharacterized protein I303_00683 [Kwoniella dejecticola CBS 10117]OBR88866.1 hypothetical protein I303_00683 [Kwoniella dejecticola CBS 10117]
MSKDLAAIPLEDESDPAYTHFAHRDEFLGLLNRFCLIEITAGSTSREDEDEEVLLNSLGSILDYYLPLPGLLDPSLDEIVPRLIDLLAQNLHLLIEDEFQSPIKTPVNPNRLARLGKLLNWLVKVRGWKAIVPHFPSSIPNLPMLVTLLSPPTAPSASTTPSTPHHPLLSSPDAWELRAVLLLWLALLLTVPFNLTTLSSNTESPLSTSYGIDLPSSEILFPAGLKLAPLAKQVILLSTPLLYKPGKEGAYAALVIARLYSREDASRGLEGFLEWSNKEMDDNEREGETHFITSILEFIALLPSLLKLYHLPLLQSFLDDKLLPHLKGSRTAASSGLIRKLAVKAKGRIWLAKIGKRLEDDEDVELPDGLEDWLDDLMGGLSDKDTIVRYSSAKYLARLAALLPPSFASQIVEAVTGLFAGTEEEPVTLTSFGTVIDPGGTSTSGGTMGFGGLESTRGEARWHGVCLALAEMARRGLVRDEEIGNAVKWVIKALTFDLRRASHSIGANVRDAASYLLWSLSRACPPDALRGYAEDMATSLICVALFDREVGVRRAASAAFQEGVGRLGLYPEGIDVLGKTDFYSVSVRRMAFTIAAPAVAVHKAYRDIMREHLHHITFRHWDTPMRLLAAQALQSILKLGSDDDIQDSLGREMKELASLDSVNVHGALVSLGSIAELFKEHDLRRLKISEALTLIRPASFVSSQAADILSSLCSLLVAILDKTVLTASSTQGVLDKCIDLSMKRREAEVHDSVAKVYGRLSEFRSPDKDILKLISDTKTFRIAQRQAASLSLGFIRYPASSPSTDKAIKALLALLDQPDKIDIESRRSAIRSLGEIATQRVDGEMIVSQAQFANIFGSLVRGLEDYATDQRGDVGSWVRIQSLQSIGKVLSTLDPSTTLMTADTLDEAVGGIIKQGVEKLESVRGDAALTLAKLREAGWGWEHMEGMEVDLSRLISDVFRYIPQNEWFASSMQYLNTRYRKQILAGLVLSIGSQVVTLSQAACEPLIAYLRINKESIPPVLSDLLELLEKNFTSNRIFIPTLQTLQKLSIGGIFGSSNSVSTVTLAEAKGNNQSILDILAIACKGITNIKSIDRITSSMRLIVSCLSSSRANRSEVIGYLPLFLGHKFPRIRAISSEELYLAISSSADGDDANAELEVPEELEEILLETEWTSSDFDSEHKLKRMTGLMEEMYGLN